MVVVVVMMMVVVVVVGLVVVVVVGLVVAVTSCWSFVRECMRHSACRSEWHLVCLFFAVVSFGCFVLLE